VCCCPACAARWSGSGADPAEVRARLRAEVRRLIDGGDLGAEATLPAELDELLLRTRQAATDALRERVLAAISETLGSAPRIVLHGAVDPWVTGALPGLTPAAAQQVDSVVLQCWQPGPASVSSVATARAQLPDRVQVGGYVTAVGANPVPDMSGYVGDLANAGATELHLYHLGLAGPARLPDLAAAVAAARRTPSLTTRASR